MKPLLTHQKQILERLEREPRPRAVLLQSPPGSGLGEVLVRVAASAAGRSDLVVVISDRTLIVEQWIYRLAEAGVQRILELRSNSDVLLALENAGSSLEPGQVVVAPARRFRLGVGRQLVERVQPDLLIVDRMGGLDTGYTQHIVEGLSSRAKSVIVLANTAAPKWFEPTQVFSLTLRDLLRGPPSIQTLLYTSSAREIELFTRASNLITDSTSSPLRLQTRAALQAALLRLIGRLSDEHQGEDGYDDESSDVDDSAQGAGAFVSNRLQEAWAILDSLEDLGHDSRLDAVMSLLERAAEANRPCIVLVTALLGEADYVAGYLRSHNIQVVLLTAASSHSEHEQSGAVLRQGGVVVLTSAAFSLLSDLPPGLLVVWWSQPSGAEQAAEWLAYAARSEDSTAVAIMAEPPLPGELDV